MGLNGIFIGRRFGFSSDFDLILICVRSEFLFVFLSCLGLGGVMQRKENSKLQQAPTSSNKLRQENNKKTQEMKKP